MTDIYNEEPISEINIIPFVDIILVVLIVFMITAPQLIREGFSVQLPKMSSAKKIADYQFAITVTNTGDVLLDGQLMSLKDLSLYARKVLENNPVLARVVIFADQSVSHGRVMDIINTMKESGIQNFTFAVQ